MNDWRSLAAYILEVWLWIALKDHEDEKKCECEDEIMSHFA